MPEGDTIHSLARALSGTLVGRPIRAAWSRAVDLDKALVGRTILATGAVGKHLLLRLDDPTVLRIHLGLQGHWHHRSPEVSPRAPRGGLGLALHTAEGHHLVTRPREVERLRARDLPIHPILTRLGPDLALPDPDLPEVIRRAREPSRARWALADLLLCQQVAAGIGNVYKSELLFLHDLDPWQSVARTDDDTLRAVYDTAACLIRRNIGPGPRNTTGRPSPRLWIYGAVHRGCPRCGGRVRHQLQGPWARRTWWCTSCQGPGPTPRS